MNLLKRISLRQRIFFLLCAIVLVTSAGGIALIWYTYRIDARLTQLIDRNLAAYQAAEELEKALVNQKGFVSYYFLDNDPGWLRQLSDYRRIFAEQLTAAQTLVETDLQRQDVQQIASEYQRYIEIKDRVIEHYQRGEREAGAALHPAARQSFFKILRLCENYKDRQTTRIQQAKAHAQRQAGRYRLLALAAMAFDFVLGILLANVVTRHILTPVRNLTREAERCPDPYRPADEIDALEHSVRGLLDDVDESQSQLAKSREHLLQAEKMAMVGKLAAGMAHGIRNPFTSVKMRLFSLSRSLNLSTVQREDFEVIDQEIHHIDTIIQNFLEFSRTPRLETQRISPSLVVDRVIQLLGHRLKAHDVNIETLRPRQLPFIEADPERLKEAMVNLIVNACEAMQMGGRITIQEETVQDDALGPAVAIRIGDSGPGIAPDLRAKIFQPFFTTKEEGTGLGLSIVQRIIDDHRGRVEVRSQRGRGTVFSLLFPVTG